MSVFLVLSENRALGDMKTNEYEEMEIELCTDNVIHFTKIFIYSK